MTIDRDQLREALVVLIDVFKNPRGNLTPDYGEICGDGFQMMSMHPNPVAVASALSRLPDILAALATTKPNAGADWFAGDVDCDGNPLITLPLREVRNLVFRARISGGTAGRDDDLCAALTAIEQHLPALEGERS